MSLCTSNQHPRRIAHKRLQQSARHITRSEPDILEHPLIQLGELPDLAAMSESFGKVRQRTDELLQSAHAGQGHSAWYRLVHRWSPYFHSRSIGLERFKAFQGRSRGFLECP